MLTNINKRDLKKYLQNCPSSEFMHPTERLLTVGYAVQGEPAETPGGGFLGGWVFAMTNTWRGEPGTAMVVFVSQRTPAGLYLYDILRTLSDEAAPSVATATAKCAANTSDLFTWHGLQRYRHENLF